MMRSVAGSTGLTRRQADEAVVTTLTVLAETISAEETRDLLAQLPKTIRDRVPVSGTTLEMRPIEFMARVADLAPSPSDIDTETCVRAVFSVLTQAVNAGEMNDIAEELGVDYADLLDRTERIEREEARDALDETPDPLATFGDPAPVVTSSYDPPGGSLVDLVLSAPAALANIVVELLRKPLQTGIDLLASVRR